MKSEPEKLLKNHRELTHSKMMKVTSHVQRETPEWFINTIMVEGYEVPFRFKRKQAYKNIKGQRVNLTYYPTVEKVAGLELEIMKVVRIKIS